MDFGNYHHISALRSVKPHIRWVPDIHFSVIKLPVRDVGLCLNRNGILDATPVRLHGVVRRDMI
jgi:hypothetical protein